MIMNNLCQWPLAIIKVSLPPRYQKPNFSLQATTIALTQSYICYLLRIQLTIIIQTHF
jgi:hypothetical protein